MNISRKLLRTWLTIISATGFLIGWIFISHTVEAKTTTQVGSTTVNRLAIQAIPTLNGQSSGNNNVQTFSVKPVQPQPSDTNYVLENFPQYRVPGCLLAGLCQVA
jgi:hypothetical protein